jgi:inosine/xanthosine triphosphate pyrophosphatase family protein/diadenosine tetraphosphate (Ap4A) HIT family hydrolase
MFLLTSNPRKYAPLADVLASMQISLRKPEFDLPELQDLDFEVVVAHKAKTAAAAIGTPCLIDDAGLLLDACPDFPGPMTGTVVRSLGAAGLGRLLAGVTDRARMVCHIGCWIDGRLWHWQGEVAGRLDLKRPVTEGPGPLTQWFVPDESGSSDGYEHRRRALAALGRDMDVLLTLRREENITRSVLSTPAACNRECVFCQEFDGTGRSVYHEMLGRELPSRVVHRTEHFVAFPPLGQFIEGGILLATQDHQFSMATLPDAYYEELDRLMAETCDLLAERYGCRPLMFEHAPAALGDKGTCCVDHAHLNVFPARVDVHAHLRKFPHVEIGHISNLSAAWFRQRPYLFLQTNEGRRFVYDAGIVPSQYVRRIVTRELGMPERWHWREYPGLDELRRTFAALSPWKSSHATTP